ncbi:hypothetical protein [Bradyrhizobium japonicum]|nr:hypothetical protein [Bradyrhizobium japonicum]MCP1768649.1 hypothetical protein [Bradyrhizobium japonicum]MCP1794319.1 hypothetical protein [Bradyrhizobium japonicum]MCP1810925.1 hypothetical protein [Bradyrhizobium japonicum]MCP1821222.1 hypothetical protein [Bradyrhizobium japonicum]MCP1876258.1 hypothetical protein [Bradyrhizobium japonicum]
MRAEEAIDLAIFHRRLCDHLEDETLRKECTPALSCDLPSVVDYSSFWPYSASATNSFAAPTSKRMAEFGAKHGVQDPCGHILIRKDVQPKRYELQEYGPAFDPPIEIAVMVDHDVLDRLFETARSTIEANRVLGLSLTVASTALPIKSLGFIILDDLDVSQDQARCTDGNKPRSVCDGSADLLPGRSLRSPRRRSADPRGTSASGWSRSSWCRQRRIELMHETASTLGPPV